MSSELVIVLCCDTLGCKEMAVSRDCITFVNRKEWTNEPYAAVEYLHPTGWEITKGKSHFCPKCSSKKCLKNISAFDINKITNADENVFNEEPTRKTKIINENKNR